MEIINASGNDTQTRTTTTSTPTTPGTGSHAINPNPEAPPAKVWMRCAAGASLQLPNPTGGTSTVEFQLPNGRTLVQAVDAHTERVELRRAPDGSFHTVITVLPRVAVGGR